MPILSKLITLAYLIFIPPLALASPFISGGLGLTYHELVIKYGPKESTCPFSKLYGNYPCLQSGMMLITNTISKKNIEEIKLLWPIEMDINQARMLVSAYFPTDWKKVRTYKINFSEEVVDLYYSPSLAKRFNKNEWDGEKAGTFMAVHSPNKRFVLIAIGNNP